MKADPETSFDEFLSDQVREVRVRRAEDVVLPDERYAGPEAVGEGAQKVIYRVWDAVCSREVAMAVLREDGEQARARFLREAKVTALLEHPGIMPVYDHGLDKEGRPFFTMRLCRGRTLEDVATDGGWSLADRVSAFTKVCEALAYAHARGVMHRDLKPANVQVGDFGEVLLSDWGLAGFEYEQCDEAILDDELLSAVDLKVSLGGRVKGTPGYVAPEQLKSARADGAAAEIFALGAILHRLLTGRLAMEGETAGDVLEATKAGRLKPFQHERESLPEGLVAIGLKALSVEPGERYASVAEMLEDLRRYQEGFATEAERAGLRTQLILFYRRNTAACNTALAFAILVALVVAVALVTLRQKERYASGLVDELVDANTAREEAEREAAPLYVARAREAFTRDDLSSALALAEVAHSYDPELASGRLILGKTLMARQEFARAAPLLRDVDDPLAAIAARYAELKTGSRLSHAQLMEFLKEVGTSVSEGRAYIYRTVLFEEFQITRSVDEQVGLIKAELSFRNPEVSEIHLSMSVDERGRYTIDLSDNPGLTIPYIFEKLGPIEVRRLDISNTAIKSLNRFALMTIDTFELRHTPKVSVDIPVQSIRHLDAEGSAADLSVALEDSQAEHLNIHDSGFRRYGVLLSMPRLRTLIVSKGALPEDVRAGLPAECDVIER